LPTAAPVPHSPPKCSRTWIERVKHLFELRRSVSRRNALQQRSRLRQMLAHRIRQCPRRPQKDSRVPVVIPGGNKFFCPVLIRFLGKPPYMQRRSILGKVARLNVAVAGLGARGLNAQHHHVVAQRGQRNAFLQRLQKARLVGDHMVRRKHPQHRVRILSLDQERRQPARRRCIARHRLLHNLPGRQSGNWSAISCARYSL